MPYQNYELINILDSFLKNSNIKYYKDIMDNMTVFYNDEIKINVTITNNVSIIFENNIDYDTKCKYMNFILKIFDTFEVIK